MENAVAGKRKLSPGDEPSRSKKTYVGESHNPSLSNLQYGNIGDESVPRSMLDQTPTDAPFASLPVSSGLDDFDCNRGSLNFEMNNFEIDKFGFAPQDFISNDSPDEICFGMLYDVHVQLNWNPGDYVPVHFFSECGDLYFPLGLDLKADCAVVTAFADQRIGVLTQNLFNALSLCMREEGIKVGGWVREAEWKSREPDFRALLLNEKKRGLMSISLNVFGPRAAGSFIAKSLGDRHLFLQDPETGLYIGSYENPQLLSIPEEFSKANELDISIPDSLMTAELRETSVPSDNAAAGSSEVDNLVTEMDSFMDHLPSFHSNTTAFRDERIITEMFEHQKDGLQFMIQRETNSFIPGNLWTEKTVEGQKFFQHKITHAKSKTAEEFQGGILADVMGLGKTLTMIALIVQSLDVARLLASQSTQRSISGNRFPTVSKSTVVIVPSEPLLNMWVREIEKHLRPFSVHYVKYHGQDRRKMDETLHQQDIILTTYGTLMAERRRANSALYQTKWYRLVLDEAHTIRNASSKQFSAVNAIQSQIRWCLTGTPIQNSLDDLGSLIRFLKMPIFQVPATYRKHVTRLKPVVDKPVFENLQSILSAICLRRNKTHLPSQGEVTEDKKIAFTDKERAMYRSLEISFKRAIDIGSKGIEVYSSHKKAMESLLRLRMFCNNGPFGGFTGLGSHSRPDEILSYLQQGGEAACTFCSDPINCISGPSDGESGYLTRCCWRLICHDDMEKFRDKRQADSSSSCPVCESKQNLGYVDGDDPIARPSTEMPYPSKIRALVEDVQSHQLQSKCIIFTYWKSSLNMISEALQEKGISSLRVDGDVPPKKRNEILLKFQNRQAARVLLITFSTGAVGLNGLTVANRIHILEPQWNPATEKQAIGRLVRLDQRQKVTILKYTVNKSVEEFVQSKQHLKLQMARGGFSSQRGSRKEHRPAHMEVLREYMNPETEDIWLDGPEDTEMIG